MVLIKRKSNPLGIRLINRSWDIQSYSLWTNFEKTVGSRETILKISKKIWSRLSDRFFKKLKIKIEGRIF